MELINLLGQKVRVLFDEFRTAGGHEYHLNMSGLASGAYVYRVTFEDLVLSKKMVFVK